VAENPLSNTVSITSKLSDWIMNLFPPKN
jgi:hypothetical protein